ncbi:MAG TPA: cation:proton antiporter, partial [Anseongella sp.]|nr:cation:proton antiporter [Anseongella sp.]
MLLLFDFSLPLTDPVLVFSLVLFIILLAPIILKKFRIPSLLGLILAGILVGPNGFNLLKLDSSIVLFGTVGLLYIMFLAGLELDMNEFKKNRHKSVIFGLLTFAIPMLVGFPVCYFLLRFDLIASILVSSMFATHTMVAYPIASRFGLTKNEAVTISVGGTIVADTLVLLILAVI